MSTSLKSTHNEIMPKYKISCKEIWRIQWEYSKRFTNLCTWVFVTDNGCFSSMSMGITFHGSQNYIFARTCDRDVYVNPEANCNWIWWLNNYSLWIKWHFSLLNSNRSWLKNVGAMSQMDSTMFYYFDITHFLVAGQVCDFILSGSENFENISHVTIWMGHHIEEEAVILFPC